MIRGDLHAEICAVKFLRHLGLSLIHKLLYTTSFFRDLFDFVLYVKITTNLKLD